MVISSVAVKERQVYHAITNVCVQLLAHPFALVAETCRSCQEKRVRIDALKQSMRDNGVARRAKNAIDFTSCNKNKMPIRLIIHDDILRPAKVAHPQNNDLPLIQRASRFDR